jgi:hypothetical protein
MISENVYTKRLKLHSSLYNKDDESVIKNILGNHIDIKDIICNDVILPDNKLIIDVKYKSIEISPYKIYYIKKDEFKVLSPNSNTSIFYINNIPIKYNGEINEINSFRVETTMNSDEFDNDNFNGNFNNIDNSTSNNEFKYFAIRVENPLTSLNSSFKFDFQHVLSFDLGISKEKYTKEKITEEFKQSQIDIYKKELNVLEYREIMKFVYIESEKDIENTNYITAYIGDVDIFMNKTNGIIIAVENRSPRIICYIRSPLIIDMNSIKKFIDVEEHNYNEFKKLKKLN